MFKGKTTKKENSFHEFNGIWVTGDLIHSAGKCYIHPISNNVSVNGELGKMIVMHEIDPETLCRSFDRTDDIGNDIYENDILYIEQVMYDENSTSYSRHRPLPKNLVVNNFHMKCEYTSSGMDTIDHYLDCGYVVRCHVVGNVFDNPELLK